MRGKIEAQRRVLELALLPRRCNNELARNPHAPRGFWAARGRLRRCRSSVITRITSRRVALQPTPRRPECDPRDYSDRLLGSGDSSLFVLRFFCWTGDAQKILDDVFHSRDRHTGLGEFNFAYDSNPIAGIDAEIEASRGSATPTIRLHLLQQAMRRVVESRLAIPLLQDKDVTYAPADVEWKTREDGFRLVFEARFKS